VSAMMREKTTEIVKDTFFELALCLEAIFLIHKVRNDLVEEVVKTMEEIYGNTVKSLKELEGNDAVRCDVSHGLSNTYPAVERFISLLTGENPVYRGEAKRRPTNHRI